MGAAVSFIPPALGLLSSVLSSIFSGEKDRNPTMSAIEQELQQARQAREEAERKAADAQRAANDAAARVAAEQQEAARTREEISRAEQRIQEEAARAQREREEADTARAAQQEAERQAEASRRAEAESVQRADRERDVAESARASQTKAEQDAAKAAQELEDARRKWREGIQPVVWPTEEEYYGTLEARQYKEGYFHFAVAGTAGCGKSSLINAFRGVINGSKKKVSAATGVIETTLEIGRYPDPRPDYPFVWYDIPGAGTLEIPRWEYFNQQGLFIFDCIIVLWDNRLTDTDIAILDNCTRFRIPCFIVRSKSDSHIRSLANDMKALIEADEEIESEDEKDRLLGAVDSEALAKYCAESRKSVEMNLRKAELAPQRVYLVSNQTLRKVVLGSRLRAEDQAIIDEVDLLRDILATANERRCVPRRGTAKTSNSLLTEGFNMLSSAVSSRLKGKSANH